MSKTAVIYWSGTGNTQTMADAVYEGAKAQNPETGYFSVSEIPADKAAEYDNLILGCPAMGAEELEETEFEPFFSELESKLSGKKVALFGSYGWGDGEWMRTWEERVTAAGAALAAESVTAQESPDDVAIDMCKQLGSAVAAQ